MSFYDPFCGVETSASCDVCERAHDHVNHEMGLELCDECAAEVRRLEKAEALEKLCARFPEMAERRGVSGIRGSTLRARNEVAAFTEAYGGGTSSGGVSIPVAHSNRNIPDRALPHAPIMFPLANPMAGK